MLTRVLPHNRRCSCRMTMGTRRVTRWKETTRSTASPPLPHRHSRTPSTASSPPPHRRSQVQMKRRQMMKVKYWKYLENLIVILFHNPLRQLKVLPNPLKTLCDLQNVLMQSTTNLIKALPESLGNLLKILLESPVPKIHLESREILTLLKWGYPVW